MNQRFMQNNQAKSGQIRPNKVSLGVYGRPVGDLGMPMGGQDGPDHTWACPWAGLGPGVRPMGDLCQCLAGGTSSSDGSPKVYPSPKMSTYSCRPGRVALGLGPLPKRRVVFARRQKSQVGRSFFP